MGCICVVVVAVSDRMICIVIVDSVYIYFWVTAVAIIFVIGGGVHFYFFGLFNNCCIFIRLSATVGREGDGHRQEHRRRQWQTDRHRHIGIQIDRQTDRQSE